MPVGVMRLIDSLPSSERAALADRLFQAQDDLLDALREFAASTDQAVEQAFLGAWMPREVVEPIRFGTVDDLVTDLNAIELRWRLDALALVEEYALSDQADQSSSISERRSRVTDLSSDSQIP